MNVAIVEKKMRAFWHEVEVTSPGRDHPVPTIVARDVPYVKDNNRLQNLNVYLPVTAYNRNLVETRDIPSSRPGLRWLVYIHGGAWRDPLVLSNSIEPTVAHTFGSQQQPIEAVVSINYSLSPYPTHPTDPYDPWKGDQNDAAREVQHPRHVLDVIAALNFLRDVFGMQDDAYVLVGHSCGATLALQATLVEPSFWLAKEAFPQPPRPAAILGLNGLYDLSLLVQEPSTHAELRDVYAGFLRLAFGDDEADWKIASPAQFDRKDMAKRAEAGALARLIVLDQSKEDQLVPMNQTEAMEHILQEVNGVKVIRDRRMTGQHNEAWESRAMILHSIQNIIQKLS